MLLAAGGEKPDVLLRIPHTQDDPTQRMLCPGIARTEVTGCPVLRLQVILTPRLDLLRVPVILRSQAVRYFPALLGCGVAGE